MLFPEAFDFFLKLLLFTLEVRMQVLVLVFRLGKHFFPFGHNAPEMPQQFVLFLDFLDKGIYSVRQFFLRFPFRGKLAFLQVNEFA